VSEDMSVDGGVFFHAAFFGLFFSCPLAGLGFLGKRRFDRHRPSDPIAPPRGGPGLSVTPVDVGIAARGRDGSELSASSGVLQDCRCIAQRRSSRLERSGVFNRSSFDNFGKT